MFTRPILYFALTYYAGTAITHTNQTVAFTELNAASNRREDLWLAGLDECRCNVNGGVVGAAGTLGEVQFSLDAGSNWTTLVTCPADADVAGNRAGTWQAIPAAAKTDVLTRAGLSHGDANADPTVGGFRMQCRKR